VIGKGENTGKRLNAKKALEMTAQYIPNDTEVEIIPLSDILDGQWYTPYVRHAYRHKIIQAKSDGKYYP